MNTQTSEATLTGQALENSQPTFDVVVDCGNSNVKATLVRGGSIVRTEHFGSRIRYTNANDVNGAWGGFTLGSKSVHVGDNCGDTSDVISIGTDAQGKLKYLTYLLAGACSVLHRSIPVGSHLRFHILTLSLDATKQVQASIQQLTELKINDTEQKYTVELVRLLPEGVGCSFYVATAFKKAKAISVLDIGGGTMNLSSYTIANGEPERRSFTFEGTGILKFKDELCNFIKLTTTNGQVNETLVEYALAQNSSVLMDGTDISKPLAQAVESWVNMPRVQNILPRVTFNVDKRKTISILHVYGSSVGTISKIRRSHFRLEPTCECGFAKRHF